MLLNNLVFFPALFLPISWPNRLQQVAVQPATILMLAIVINCMAFPEATVAAMIMLKVETTRLHSHVMLKSHPDVEVNKETSHLVHVSKHGSTAFT
jgi:hypothetical protein